MRVKDIRLKFIEMTRALRTGGETELHNFLLSMIPETKQSMEFAGKRIMDSPLLINVWVPAEADVANNPGIWYAYMTSFSFVDLLHSYLAFSKGNRWRLDCCL
jgi:hypothetical protein